MKTQEELKALKEEVEAVSKKLAELTDEELEQVTGGTSNFFGANTGSDSLFKKPETPENQKQYNYHIYK